MASSIALFSAYNSGEHASPQSGPEESEDEQLFRGKRIIIVEDEGITQMQLRKSLTRFGLDVVGTAGTGEAGIEICLRERPEIVLMDINMPGKIDGLEAVRRILKHYRPCVIMLTAYTEHEEEANRLGVCGYIVKPVDAKMLWQYLRKAFSKFQSTP